MGLLRSPIISFLVGAKPVFFVLPLLMVILIIGTISQRYIGLNEAENLFFTSWFLWIGPVPIPATMPLLGFIAICLFLKIIFKSKWCWPQAGIILTHIGVLVLLIGGLLTFIDSEEGYITLGKGQSSAMLADYHQRELVVYADGKSVKKVPAELLANIGVVKGLPFGLKVSDYCRNCMPAFREDDGNYKGLAAKLFLKEQPLKKEDETNLGGATLNISGVSGEGDGTYIIYEAIPRYPEFEYKGKNYQIRFEKAQRKLPFSVRLDSFRKFTYPGSMMASEYESKVTIIEASGLEWSQDIRMNEPLRTQGYTIYQSSFLEGGGQQLSVLAVVKNRGAIFPYIASIIMAIGLIWHVLLRRRKVEL